MKKRINIDTIISVFYVINIVRIIALERQIAKDEKRYTERINNLVDANCHRDSIISEWFQNDKISSEMYMEYCERRSKKLTDKSRLRGNTGSLTFLKG